MGEQDTPEYNLKKAIEDVDRIRKRLNDVHQRIAWISKHRNMDKEKLLLLELKDRLVSHFEELGGTWEK